MDRWNRLAVALVATFLVVAAVVTLLAATEATDPDFLPGGSGDESWFYDQLNGLAQFDGRDQGIAIAVSLVVAMAMLVLVIVELSMLRRRGLLLPVSSAAEGSLNIEAGSVRLLAERTGSLNPYVNSLRCALTLRGRRTATGGPASIIIRCYPRLVLGSNVQEVRDDLQTRIKAKVEQLTGITVIQVNVSRVRFDRSDDTRVWALRETDE